MAGHWPYAQLHQKSSSVIGTFISSVQCVFVLVVYKRLFITDVRGLERG